MSPLHEYTMRALRHHPFNDVVLMYGRTPLVPNPQWVKQMDIVAYHSAMSDAPFGTEPNSPLVTRNFSSACVVCRSSDHLAWSKTEARYRPVFRRRIGARAFPQLIIVQSSLFQLVTVIVRHCYPYVESLQHDPQYDPTTRLTRL